MPVQEQQRMNEDEWRAEGARRFGADQMAWRFRCPVCGHVASPADWKAAKAPEGAVAFSCVGRYLPKASDAFSGKPGPCNYAGGGLIGMNPVEISRKDGGTSRLFAFAD